MSTDYHFAYDATSIRIKARTAAAIPDPAKALRKLVVAGQQSSGVDTTARARKSA